MLTPWTMVKSKPGLMLRTMSGSLVLPRLGSVLISMVCVVMKDHTDVCGLGHNLWPCWYTTHMKPPASCQSEWAVLPHGVMALSQARLLLRDKFGSVALLQPESELISMTPDSVKSLVYTWGLSSHLSPVLVYKGSNAISAILIRVASAATWGHGYF